MKKESGLIYIFIVGHCHFGVYMIVNTYLAIFDSYACQMLSFSCF